MLRWITMEIHLPPEQEAHLAALAASAGRSTDDLVQEAVALWEEQQAVRQAPQRPQHTPAEAAARILELRKGNILPAGETIKDLINYGRA
jgi:Arc/MetJ-type ribon-helix-helix transcriptional regulator